MRNRSKSVASWALVAAMAGITVLGVQCASADPLPAGSPAFSGMCPRCTPEDAPDTSVPHVELVSDSADTLPTFTDGARRFVLGQTGARYRVKIVNPTGARIEAVLSVDGLDAIDGRTADLTKRGYIVPAYGETLVDGWRTSLATVATFRFSPVSESYAGRKGQPRNVGVVGVAFFEEKPPIVWRRPAMHRAAPTDGFSDDRDAPSSAPVPAMKSAPAPMGGGSAAGAAAPAARPASKSAEERRATLEPSPPRAEQRPGLGTQFGEAADSRVVEVGFVRASASPSWVSELRYDDRAGLLARGIVLDPPRDPRAAENVRRDEAESFPGARFAQPPP